MGSEASQPDAIDTSLEPIDQALTVLEMFPFRAVMPRTDEHTCQVQFWPCWGTLAAHSE